MIEYLLKNKEWIFSGIGVFLLTYLFSIWTKMKKDSKEHVVNDHSVQNSNIVDSLVNSFSSENIQINQTFVQRKSANEDPKPNEWESIKVAGYPDLTKANDLALV